MTACHIISGSLWPYKHRAPRLNRLGSPSLGRSASPWRCTSPRPYTQTALDCRSSVLNGGEGEEGEEKREFIKRLVREKAAAFVSVIFLFCGLISRRGLLCSVNNGPRRPLISSWKVATR